MTSGGNRQKWTLSMWVKWTNPKGQGGSSYQRMYDAGGDTDWIRFNESDCVLDASFASGGADFKTNRVFRDCSSWYHLVIRCDTTSASSLAETDRYRLYVNGIEETSFSTDDTASLGFEGATNQSGQDVVLGGASTTDQNFNGLMSHVHMCDGYSYAPTEFGETDSTTGEWKIKVDPSVSHGSQGFWLKMEDSSNMDLDSSSNGHTFTTSGNLTATEDCPSDVFATMNPLVTDTDMTLINGNNTQQRTSASWDYSVSTLGANKGKYYFEGKIGGTGHWILGATDDHVEIGQNELGNGSGDAGWRDTGDVKVANSSVGYGGSITYTSSDVVCVAMDLDNHKIYFRKNGDAWINSGDPTSGATGTGAFNLASTTKTYFFAVCSYITSGTGTWDINFGNGYFGTTAISSEGTNASSIGKFEHDVPTGYTALSTKGLNS